MATLSKNYLKSLIKIRTFKINGYDVKTATLKVVVQTSKYVSEDELKEILIKRLELQDLGEPTDIEIYMKEAV